LEVHGLENLPREGGRLLISNHASNLDPMLVGSPLPRICRFLAKEELFEVPLFKYWMRAVGALPIHRGGVDRKAMGACVRLLKTGSLLVIFPEGTRTRDGLLGGGKPGVAMIAAQAGTPCVPTYVDGSFESFPRGGKFPRPVKIHVWYGPSFDLPPRQEGAGTKEHYQACADAMMARIGELRERALAARIKEGTRAAVDRNGRF
jgi:1-acyl-sn-glycerol-3-phosphate acyltransferase